MIMKLKKIVALSILIITFLPGIIQAVTISGTLTDAVTGQTISNGVLVTLADEAGVEVSLSLSDDGGRYQHTDLAPGNYLLIFDDFLSGYLGEMYDDIHCESFCDLSLATIITLDVDDLVIDADLLQRVMIFGSITDEESGEPVAEGYVRLLDEEGNELQNVTFKNGSYVIETSPGSYRLYFDAFTGISNREKRKDSWLYIDELHGDVPCVNMVCDVQSSTLVEAVGGHLLIDAQLKKGEIPVCQPYEIGRLPDFAFAHDATIFKNKIYIASSRGIYRWEGHEKWTEFPPSRWVDSIANNGERIVAAYRTDTDQLRYSDDGDTWKIVDVDLPTSPQELVWTGAQFIGAVYQNFLSSPNGVDWTVTPIPDSAGFFGVAEGGQGGNTTVIGGIAGLWYSLDQTNWVKISTGASILESFFDVKWTGSRILAVGLRDEDRFDNVSDGEFVAYHSVDGQSWVQSVAPTHPSPFPDVDFRQEGRHISIQRNGHIVVQTQDPQGTLLSTDDGISFQPIETLGGGKFVTKDNFIMHNPIYYCPIHRGNFE